MISTLDNPVGTAVTMLGSFEEELAAYYQALATADARYADFWGSTSLAKASRANLYTRLNQDVVQNPNQYVLEKGPSGLFMNYFNKIRAGRENLKADHRDIFRHVRFLLEIEAALCGSPAFPSIQGKNEFFRRVVLILNKIQKSQLQIIRGLIKTSPSYRHV
jgi:hypothetical protein